MRALIILMACTFLGATPTRAGFNMSTFFDPPLFVTIIPLSQYNGHTPEQVMGEPSYFSLSCFYYPTFMVKEINTHEKGAAKLSITPSNPHNPKPCHEKGSGEISINLEGYFTGAKASYVFFSGSDSHNGAPGVFIYTSEGHPVLDDNRGNLSEHEPRTTLTIDQNGSLILTYSRFFEATCSLFGKSRERCWNTIKKETGLQGSLPTCPLPKTQDMAYVRKIPTVVEYKAVAKITGSTAKIAPDPLVQKHIGCQPSI